MLHHGVTKRGESLDDGAAAAGGAGSHHAAVHSILQSRRRNGRSKSSGRRGNSLSTSGSRLLRAISPGASSGRYASSSPGRRRRSSSPGNNGGLSASLPTLQPGAAPGSGSNGAEAAGGALPKRHDEDSRNNVTASPTSVDDALANKNKVGSNNGGASPHQSGRVEKLERKTKKRDGDGGNNDNAQTQAYESRRLRVEQRQEGDDRIEGLQNELRRRQVEQQLSIALTQQERKRSKSLSRKLLGRRGRSQQPTSGRYSLGSGSLQDVGRSLSPSRLSEDGRYRASVKVNLIRQESGSNPAEDSHNSSSSSCRTVCLGNGDASTKVLNDDPLPQPSHNNDDLSHASSSIKSRQSNATATTSKKSKSKKNLWRVMKGGWKKKKKGVRDDFARSGGTAGVTDEPPSSPTFSPQQTFDGDASVTSQNTLDQLDNSNESSGSDLVLGNPFGGEDHDAPWAPTMSMLLQTGQLDAIESDSDEDQEMSDEASINMNDEDETGRLDRPGGDFEHSSFNLGGGSDDGRGGRPGYDRSPRNRQSEDDDNNNNDNNADDDDDDAKGRLDRPGGDFEHSSFNLGGGSDDGRGGRPECSPSPRDRQEEDSSNGGRAENTQDVDEWPKRMGSGYDVDDFIGLGEDAAHSDFFDQVASSYLLATKRPMEVCCDGSGADESTLSGPTLESGLLKRSKSGDGISAERKGGEGGKHHHLSIRSLGESIVRRGRSRGRQKKERAVTSCDAAAETDGETRGARKDDVECVVSSSEQRSRSLFRRRWKTRIISSKLQEEHAQQPPDNTRGSSMDISDSRHDDGSGSPKRGAKSLPRKISHTPSTTRNSFNDSVNLGSSLNSSSLEYSDLSLNRRRKHRRKKCVVCRQKIPRGESIPYGDFYFCSGGCYACASCRRLFDREEVTSDLQIISNVRGSIVQCGECAKSLTLAPSRLRESTSDDGADDLHESIHLDDSDRQGDVEIPQSRLTAATLMSGGDHLVKAAKRLAEKASVKLSIASSCKDDDDENDERSETTKPLSTLFFMQDEDSKPTKRSSELSAKIAYVLDSDAFGNPNYDGYSCSLNNFDDRSEHNEQPRMTSVALPKLESDEIDGTISNELRVDLRWVDEDDDSECNSSDGSSSRIPLQRAGSAMLSIEQFSSEILKKETVMKVLRQTWEHEENNVCYKFMFVAPFKKIYISWEIDEGDELDLTQCRLEVTMRYDPPPEEAEPVPEDTMTNKCQGSSSVGLVGDDNDDNDNASSADGSKPGTVYVKTLSVDHSSLPSSASPASTPYPLPPTLLLARKHGGLDPDRDENDNFSELLSVASCIDSTISLPSITYVRIEKEEYECEVGLSLIEKNGATVVAEVSKSGLFRKSQIQEGCEILAINGQCVRGPRSVMRMLKDLTGTVVLMASDGPSPPGARFVVTKHKSTGFGRKDLDSESRDIAFQTVDGLVSIKEMASSGIFAESPISKGDVCLSIDGVPTLDSDVASRALGRSQSIVAMLVFSLSGFWKNVVEFIIDEKYNRWWKKDSVCALLWGNEDCAPVTLTFDERTGLCKAEGNEENEVDLRYMNIIIDRVMKLLRGSMTAYRKDPKERVRDSSRSLSVSPSGKMKNRSDVYRRALIKLDEMRENGTLSARDYEAGRLALAQVAIQTAT